MPAVSYQVQKRRLSVHGATARHHANQQHEDAHADQHVRRHHREIVAQLQIAVQLHLHPDAAAQDDQAGDLRVRVDCKTDDVTLHIC